jgi:hypothetical protein
MVTIYLTRDEQAYRYATNIVDCPFLYLHRDEQAYRYTINIVDCPFDIVIETRKPSGS